MNGGRQLNAADSDLAKRKIHPLSNKFDVSIVETWSCIQARVIPFSHIWTIRDYSFFMQDCITQDVSIQSSVFLTCIDGRTSKWFLKLTQSQDNSFTNYHISLYLHQLSSDEASMFARLSFSVLNEKLEKSKLERSGSFRFYPQCMNGFNDFVKKDFLLDKKNGLLPNDTLTIKCEINVCLEETLRSSSQSNDVEQSVRELKLANQLKSLFDGKRMSDVTLYAGDQKFPAHKVILAARSPVFAAMFEHDMLEGRQNKVTIEDIIPAVLEEMLVFIYTDDSPNLKDVALELFVAADKYQILRLKGMCEEFLCTKITEHNAVEILSLADSHNAEVLRDRVITYISSQATRLMKTQAWKDIFVKNQNLISKAFQEASK